MEKTSSTIQLPISCIDRNPILGGITCPISLKNRDDYHGGPKAIHSAPTQQAQNAACRARPGSIPSSWHSSNSACSWRSSDVQNDPGTSVRTVRRWERFQGWPRAVTTWRNLNVVVLPFTRWVCLKMDDIFTAIFMGIIDDSAVFGWSFGSSPRLFPAVKIFIQKAENSAESIPQSDQASSRP